MEVIHVGNLSVAKEAVLVSCSVVSVAPIKRGLSAQLNKIFYLLGLFRVLFGTLPVNKLQAFKKPPIVVEHGQG